MDEETPVSYLNIRTSEQKLKYPLLSLHESDFLNEKTIVSCSWITTGCVLDLGYPVQLSCRVNNSVASSPWIDVWLTPWHQNFLPMQSEWNKPACYVCLSTNNFTVLASFWSYSIREAGAGWDGWRLKSITNITVSNLDLVSGRSHWRKPQYFITQMDQYRYRTMVWEVGSLKYKAQY